MRALLLFLLISSSAIAMASDSSMCEVQPCFIDHGTQPPTARNCRDDLQDLYYQNRMKPPAPQCPGGGSGLRKVPYSSPITSECVARATQLGRSVAAMATFCNAEGARLDQAKRPPLCPTRSYIDAVRGWANRTLDCLTPSNFNRPELQKYSISPNLLFRIMAHESRGQINAASNVGKGLMQLTGSAVREFYAPNRYGLRQFWNEAKDDPACQEFRGPMEMQIPSVTETHTVSRLVRNRRGRRVRVKRSVTSTHMNWECPLTSPEGIPRHMIVATSNLLACRMQAEQEMDRYMPNMSRIASITKGDAATKYNEREAIIDDLITACHNWGAGNMMSAVRGIVKKSFKDSAEFRKTLITTGFRYTTGVGVRTFPQLTRDEYDEIEHGDPNFNQSPIKCTQ
jgi:hypothetical protein